jgi:Flp pilus assembly protein TadD
MSVTSRESALAVLDGGMPLVLDGLLPPSVELLPAALLQLDEKVRMDLTPLTADAAPTKLTNRTLIRPAEVAMPLSRAVALLQLNASERRFHAYVRHMPLAQAPRTLAALSVDRAMALASHEARLQTANLWLGDGGLRSSLHYDGHDNLLLQLAGEKVLLLVPPTLSEGHGLYDEHAEHEYIFEPDHTVERGSQTAAARESNSPALQGRFVGIRPRGAAPVENHAALPVFASPTDDSVDASNTSAATSALRASVRDQAQLCTILPGQTLFLPALWSHAVASKADGASGLNAAVNLWYVRGTASFTRALHASPHFAAGYFALGAALQTLERPSEAAAAYLEATRLRPRYFDATHNLASALQASGAAAEASASFRHATRIRPLEGRAYANLAATLRTQNRLGEAAEAYDYALTLEPRAARSYTGLGNTRALQGRLAEAISLLHAAVGMAGGASERSKAYNSLGVTLQESYRYDEAGAALRAALTLQPHSDKVRANLHALETALTGGALPPLGAHGKLDSAAASMDSAGEPLELESTSVERSKIGYARASMSRVRLASGGSQVVE